MIFNFKNCKYIIDIPFIIEQSSIIVIVNPLLFMISHEECDICHYWYFKDIGYKYETYLCNDYHDLMQRAMSFNNIAIVYIKESACRIHFW